MFNRKRKTFNNLIDMYHKNTGCKHFMEILKPKQKLYRKIN